MDASFTRFIFSTRWPMLSRLRRRRSRRTPENCTSYHGFDGFFPAERGARRGNTSPRRELAKLLSWISLRRPFTFTQYVCGRLGDAFNIRLARSPSLVRKTAPLAL